MADDPPAPEQVLAPRNAGQFRPGVSGNPRGRPAKPRAQLRADGYTNRYTGHGTARDRRSYTGFCPDVVTDLEAMALRRSEFLAKRIIEALPEEAFRRGWSLKIDGPGNAKKLAERVTAAAEDLDVDEKLVEAAQMERQSGGAAIFPVIAGAQGDLSRPLDLRSIASVRALHILEPRELQPERYYEDIRHPKWGRPERYWFTPIGGGRGGGAGLQLIHESRLVIFPGVRVSREDQWGQHASWGDSVLSPAKQVLSDFGLSWGSAATLLHEHGLGVLEVDGLADMLAAADGLDQVDRRVSAMMMAKSSLRALLVDGKDKYTRLASSLGGLAEVLNEFKQLIAGAAETPVSILLGMAQSGLRTGDDDTRSWYASVEKRRAKRYKPRHEQLLRFLLCAGDGPTDGDEPGVWSVEYPSLWTPSEKEQAETRKTDMERAKIAIEAGVASADDVAESFYGGDTYSPDIRIDWNRRRAQAKIDAERAEALDRSALEAMGREPAEDEEPAEEAPEERAAAAGSSSATRADEDGPGDRRTFAGFSIVVENPKGSFREWTDANGTIGHTKMRYAYGYIEGAQGSDGDSVDVYLGPSEDAAWVYVVHQNRKPEFAEYDEDKVMLGFDSPNHARDAYLAQYDDERFFGGMSVLSLEDFRAKLVDGGKITHAEE